MNNEQHPLIKYLRSKRVTLTAFAKENEVSRMLLYRIMNGENTTTEKALKISEATGGKVPVAALMPAKKESPVKEAAQ